MSLTAAAIDALIAAGVTVEQLGAAVKAEAVAAERAQTERREKAAAKKRAQREAAKNVPGTSGDIEGHRGTSGDIGGQAGTLEPAKDAPAPTHTRGEDKPLRLVISGSSSLDNSANARSEASDDWPKTGHVDALVEAAASSSLNPQRTPNLITTAAAILVWKRSGASWEHDVLPVVTGLAKANRGKISTWKFFDDAIGRSIADNRRALEIPEAQAPRSTGPPNDFAQRKAAEDAEARRLAFARMDAANG